MELLVVFNRVVLAIIFATFVASCASQKTYSQIEFEKFLSDKDAYHKSVSDASGNSTNADDEYFLKLTAIANKYQQAQYANVYEMMWREASLKKQGLRNDFDALLVRYDKGDYSGLAGDAEPYILDVRSKYRCNSFGYTVGAADFNKCVYDVKLQFLQMKMQIQQNIRQSFSAPSVAPVYRAPKPYFPEAVPPATRAPITCESRSLSGGVTTTCK